MTNALDIVADLIGRPYREPLAAEPVDGFDCLELVDEVYQRPGLKFPMPAAYSSDSILGIASWSLLWIRVDCPVDGNLIDFGGSHVGVVIGDRAVHSSRRLGVVAANLSTCTRGGFVSGFYRLATDEDVVSKLRRRRKAAPLRGGLEPPPMEAT